MSRSHQDLQKLSSLLMLEKMEVDLVTCTKEARRGTDLKWVGRTQLRLKAQEGSLGMDLAAVDLAGVLIWGEVTDLVLPWVMEVIMEVQDPWVEVMEVIE